MDTPKRNFGKMGSERAPRGPHENDAFFQFFGILPRAPPGLLLDPPSPPEGSPRTSFLKDLAHNFNTSWIQFSQLLALSGAKETTESNVDAEKKKRQPGTTDATPATQHTHTHIHVARVA